MKPRPKRAKEIIDAMFAREDSLESLTEAVVFCNRVREVHIEAPIALVETWKKIDGFLLRRDPPHYQGDEYHVHAQLPGGYEASWGVSGPRRHPSKFPVHIPNGLRDAAAKMLKVSPDVLEASWIGDSSDKILLIEVRE